MPVCQTTHPDQSEGATGRKTALCELRLYFLLDVSSIGSFIYFILFVLSTIIYANLKRQMHVCSVYL